MAAPLANRDQQMTQARVWRAEGVRYRVIAERLGVSVTTVYRWLNPERVAPYRNGRAIDPDRARASDRRYSATHRGECERCGGDRPRSKRGPLCARCIAEDADRAARQIEAMWKGGFPMAEICRQMQCSKGSLARRLHILRGKGYDLPYRQRLSSPRFPEQVVA